jgi:hypothetical protein
MLKEHVYIESADEFGCSVGVAHITGYKRKEEHITEYSKEDYKNLSDELEINDIINEAIDRGEYQSLMRGVLKSEKDGRKLKPLTIYKKQLNNGSNRVLKSPRKVF